MKLQQQWWTKGVVGAGAVFLAAGCIGDPSAAPSPEEGSGDGDGGSCAECTIDVTTLEAERVWNREAVLRGEWTSETVEKVDDQGFCWSGSEESLLDGESVCQGLGEGEAGVFELQVEDLTPGKRYYFQAYAEVGGEREQGEVKEFLTGAPDVTIVASQDRFGEVVVSWEEAPGAQAYRILRDEQPYATLDATLVCETAGLCRFEDFDVDTPESAEPGPPQNLEATNEDHVDKVVLTWEAPAADVESYVYQVVAIYEDAESEESNRAEGSSAAFEIVKYRIYRGEGDTDLGWIGDVMAGEALRFEDFEAAAPMIELGVVRVGQGDSEEGVPLSVEGTTVELRGHLYRVDLIDGEDAAYSSEPTRGRRGGEVENLSYQWQRTEGTNYSDFSLVVGEERDVFDGSADESGAGQYYRVSIALEGAPDTEVISEKFWGFRAVPLNFYTVGADRKMQAWNGEFEFLGEYQGTVAKTVVAVDGEGDVYIGTRGVGSAMSPGMGFVQRLYFDGTSYQAAWPNPYQAPYNSETIIGVDFGSAVDRRVQAIEVMGNSVAVGYLNGEVHVLNRHTGNLVDIFTFDAQVIAMKARSASQVYVGTFNGDVILLDIDQGSFLARYNMPFHQGSSVSGLGLTRYNDVVVAGWANGQIQWLNFGADQQPTGETLTSVNAVILGLEVTAEDFIYVLTGQRLYRRSLEGGSGSTGVLLGEWDVEFGAGGLSLAVDPYGRSIVGLGNGEVVRYDRNGQERDREEVNSGDGTSTVVPGVAVERGSKAVFGDDWDPYQEP